MEAVAPKIPLTLAERESGPGELRVSATLDEFWELAEEVDYRIEYLNGEIISFIDNTSELSVGQATDIHETLIMTLGWLFNNYYYNLDAYRVLGSNVLIYSELSPTGINADLSVVKGPSDFKVLPSGRLSKSIIRNPEIVVDVLSDSTRNYDTTDKLACYKTIPTLQHVLFVDQRQPAVSVYSRLAAPNQWLNVDYQSLTETVIVGDLALSMTEIYRKTPFTSLA